MNDPRLAFDAERHLYTLGERCLTSVTQVLAITGIADFRQPWFSDVVKERGSFMHEAVRLDVHGELDYAALDDELQGYVNGWRAFLQETGAEIDYAEQTLCDPSQGIAGRLDYILRLVERGRPIRMLIDLKRGLYPCAAIQTAGYVDMATALYDTPVYLRRGAVVLPGGGRYSFHTFTDPTDRATWQAAVRVVNWRRSNGIAA